MRTNNGNGALADVPIDGNLRRGLAPMRLPNVAQEADEGGHASEAVIAEDGRAGAGGLGATLCVVACAGFRRLRILRVACDQCLLRNNRKDWRASQLL